MGGDFVCMNCLADKLMRTRLRYNNVTITFGRSKVYVSGKEKKNTILNKKTTKK